MNDGQGTRASDVIIVGTGVAGLSAALALAATHRVHLITKTALGKGGSSPWAQGGIAAAVGADDRPELHVQDTLAVGAGLNDPAVVEILAQGGPAAIRRLLDLGAQFDRAADGQLALGREAAHSRRRILHAHGDATGAELVRALVEAVRQAPGITVFEQAFAWDLVVEDGRVVGVDAVHPAGQLVRHRAPAVILATGGCGRLYSHTTNPPEVTADGLAMAARVGARLADVEFVQFHPTALATGADPMPLVTEALRGEGAVLIDETGRRFMPALHPQAELAPRDVVARAIWREIAAGRRVYLDARTAVGEDFPNHFPTVYALCRQHGVDPRREPIPVAPAAHYHMGGVAVDAWGRASLPGLWACGEAASTGAHGANRLASNSLLEALVFGGRVAEAVGGVAPSLQRSLDEPAPSPQPLPPIRLGERESYNGMGRPPAIAIPDPVSPPPVVGGGVGGGGRLTAPLRHLMWQHVGLERDAAGLTAALTEMGRMEANLAQELTDAAPSRALGEARNLLAAGHVVAAAALARRESRGAHFRADFPEADPRWGRRMFVVVRGQALDIALDRAETVATAETARIPESPEPALPPRGDR